MPKSSPRFSVSRKIALSQLIIITVGTASMLFIYRGLDEVAGALQRLAEVKAPISAAAYEQELNVNGKGLAVLKYLATRRDEYRSWAKKDEQDFLHYHAQYLRLVGTDEERALGERLGELHLRFREVGEVLMALADRQELLYAQIKQATDEIDYLIDARLQPRLFAGRAVGPAGFGAAVTSADLEAETAEVAQWVATYHREPTPEARAAIFRKLRAMERTYANLLAYDLAQSDRRHARALGGEVARVTAAIGQVVDLEDAIHASRVEFIELRTQMDQLLDERMQPLALRGLDLPREQAKSATDAVLVAMRYMIPVYLLAAVVIGWLLVRVIRVPLAELNRGTRAVASGDLSYQIAATANDEFGDLAQQFNQMVDQLQATTVSRDRLEESERRLQGMVTELRHEIAERGRAERERERLQAELRRNETMTAMGALVAGVAHEVRNPLFGISSTLDAMDARLGAQGEHGRYLSVLRSEVDRLVKLMSDLLSYGRSPARGFVVDSLASVVARAVEESGLQARDLAVSIVSDAGSGVDAIRLDPDRLVLAFRNLIDNALQHAPAGSAVTLTRYTVEQDGRTWACCRIADHGPGFRPEDLVRVFEPFFTRRRGGTGLGLALVQRIVDEHGGTVTACNQPGGGAEVIVRFPIVAD